MLRQRARRPAGFPEPSLPSPISRPPAGPDWIHEIKHDGFRLMARRDGPRLRLVTRGGYDWTARYPRIGEALAGLAVRSALIDGEVVCCDGEGRADFARLRSRRHDATAFLYAFDLMELDGEDLRGLALERRKAKLARLLARARPGIHLTDHFDGDGSVIFPQACALGLEGIVSKRRDSPYVAGRTRAWLKAKNPQSAAVVREATEDWRRARLPRHLP
jgi:ATP-dependent DNA ligase